MPHFKSTIFDGFLLRHWIHHLRHLHHSCCSLRGRKGLHSGNAWTVPSNLWVRQLPDSQAHIVEVNRLRGFLVSMGLFQLMMWLDNSWYPIGSLVNREYGCLWFLRSLVLASDGKSKRIACTFVASSSVRIWNLQVLLRLVQSTSPSESGCTVCPKMFREFKGFDRHVSLCRYMAVGNPFLDTVPRRIERPRASEQQDSYRRHACSAETKTWEGHCPRRTMQCLGYLTAMINCSLCLHELFQMLVWFLHGFPSKLWTTWSPITGQA